MKKISLIIETPRLLLRPFELKDIEPAYQMNLDPAVSQYTGDGGVVSREETARRITEDVLGDYKKHGFGRLAIEWKATQTFIGFAGLKYLEDLKEVDLGYRLRSEYWGKGIATEAGRASLALGFSKLDLKRIIAMVLPGNTKSERVIEKLGMTYIENIIEEGEPIKIFQINRNTFMNK